MQKLKNMKALLCGYYGKGNGGDEALLVSLLQMLPEDIQPIVLSGNPQETRKLYNVESCPRTSTFAVWQAIQKSDFFIWGGGSLMQDATSIASPIYYAGLMALAQQQGLKTIAWAQGIGPLNKSFSKWMTRNVLQGCSAVSVRDRASAKLLADWQMSPIIAPDPVWALESIAVDDILLASDVPKIAVTLRSHPLLTTKRLNSIAAALKAFQEQTSTHILLIPFQPEQDLAIAKTLHQVLENQSQIISLKDPRKLKGLFENVAMTIGMRLHSLIMAAAENSRCFALSYDPKVSQLMAEYQIPGWELSDLPEDTAKITQTWIDNYTNPNPLETATIKSIKDRALIHREVLLNGLQN
ncbi:polysaccharide pyruvyl transferase CsaB [Hyella patelloides]|nr:polysaccharide pyruvyl transferase CsaB [Hyella patelloides]